MTQKQIYRKVEKNIAEANLLFMDLVNKGDITKKELRINIKKRPCVWNRFSQWLNSPMLKEG